MIYFEIAAGLILLIIGGDLLVRGSVGVARYFGVSPLLIGLTLIGFGTSTPELVASVQAALAHAPGIAVGNVVGSNIANSLLILGVAALVRPLETPSSGFRRDAGMMLLSALACTGVVLAGFIGRWMGAALLGLLIVYMVYTYRNERVAPGPAREGKTLMNPWVAALAAIGALVMIILGARLLVFGAINLAQQAGISETVLGLTVVAVGTSLPELAAAIIAALRGHPFIAFGNVVGSNIYNVLGILGATALIHPIVVPEQIAHVDIWVMLAAMVLLTIFAATGWRLSRAEGAALLTAYAAYIGYLIYAA
ncbi:MAG: calcium/sodium antiporter [Rhodomicrobiaceae bacterium]